MRQTKRYIDICTWAMRRYSTKRGQLICGVRKPKALDLIESLAYERYIKCANKPKQNHKHYSSDGVRRAMECVELKMKPSKPFEFIFEPQDYRLLPFHRQIQPDRKIFGWTVFGPTFYQKHWTIDGMPKLTARVIVKCLCLDDTPTILRVLDLEEGYFKDCGCGYGDQRNSRGEWIEHGQNSGG